MKKGMTIEEHIAELEKAKARANAYKKLIEHIDSELEWRCDRVVETEGYYEDYIDDDGNPQRKWHSTVYKVDEDGNYIRIEPDEDSIYYDEWVGLKAIREEILAII